MTTEKQADPGGRSWVEEIEVAGEALVAQVRKWAADASVRRIRVKAPNGDIAVDVPLTVGGVVGGAVVVAAPVLAVLGALAALVAKVNVEIVRAEPEGEGEGAEGEIIEGRATEEDARG